MLSWKKPMYRFTLSLLSLSVVGFSAQPSFAIPLKPLLDIVGGRTVNGITQGLFGISLYPEQSMPPNQSLPPQGGQFPQGMPIPLDANGFPMQMPQGNPNMGGMPIPLDANGFPLQMPQGNPNMGGMPQGAPLPPMATPSKNGTSVIINNY